MEVASSTAPQSERPESVLQSGHTNYISAIAISPDSRLVASGGWDDTIKIWNISERKLWRTLEGLLGFVEALAFSPDGRLLASGTRAGLILFDVVTGSQIRNITACDAVLNETRALSDVFILEPSSVTSVAFSPDGTSLVSACDADASIKVWDPATGLQVGSLDLPPETRIPARQEFSLPIAKSSAGVNALAFDAGGRWLAAAGNELFSSSGASDRQCGTLLHFSVTDVRDYLEHRYLEGVRSDSLICSTRDPHKRACSKATAVTEARAVKRCRWCSSS